MDTVTVLLIKGDPADCEAYVEKTRRSGRVSLLGTAATKGGALELVKENMPDKILIGEEEIEMSMNRRIQDELRNIGLKPRRHGPPSGFEYLTDAIRLTMVNSRHYYGESERRYAAAIVHYRDKIAQDYDVSAAHVERAMQRAIDRTWRTADQAALDNYTARPDPYRNIPTVSEFVEHIAKKIKPW